MILEEIRGRVYRKAGAGVGSVDSRFDEEYINGLINDVSRNMIKGIYLKTKFVHQNNLQPYYPLVEKSWQENVCYTKIFMPRVIALDGVEDGLRYLGSPNKNNNYYRVKSRSEFSDAMHNNTIKSIMQTKSVYLYDGDWVEVYSKTNVTEILIEAVFSNPMNVPNFNREIDNYPLSDDFVDDVVDMICKGDLFIELSQAPDTVTDSKDSITMQNIKNRR